MRVRVLTPLACLALLAGCFNPDDGSAADADTDLSTGPGSTSGAPTTDDPSVGTTGSGVDSLTSTTLESSTTDADTTSADETSGGPAESSGSSSGEPIPIECGDGIPAPGEVCFDDAAVLNAGDIGYSPRVGEVNGDGNVDLLYLYGDQIVVRLGAGDGTFGPELPDETLYCDTMELADVDGDDVLDHVCTVGYENILSVSLGNGTGSFMLQTPHTQVGDTPVEIAAGDLNGDGNADVATIHADTTGSRFVRISLSQGNGLFTISDTVSTGNLPGADVTLGDFTGDGVSDVAFTVAEGTNQVRIAVNDGDGDFGQALDVNAATSGAFGIAAGDFNGDEDDDLAVANAGSVLAILGTGIASFEKAVSLDVPEGAIANRVAVDDVTNDDLADIIAVYSNQAIVSVFPSNGDGTFGERVDVTIAAVSDSLSTGDVNDDGVPDLVIGSTSEELVTVVVSTP
ncbi:MAG: FG-GAP-like repeat-containing protein [Nannocystaceae bacterium]|nr:VCBS repeat-containing protein [bacterium]